MITRALQALAGHGNVEIVMTNARARIVHNTGKVRHVAEGPTLVAAFVSLWRQLYPEDTVGPQHAETCELCDGLVGLAKEQAERHGNANVRLSCFASTRGHGGDDQAAGAELIADQSESVRAATPQEAMAGLLKRLNR